ncbi:MAG TPA: AsmA-like C-terminal region-containing protein [Methylomirabilota bacterium]|nr:AsmA-like C-terminal region-containing protein [Methylomirabilota bacterium]
MLKWALIGLLVVALVVVGSILALPWLLDTPAIQAYIQQAAGHALGRPIKFSGLSISALPLPTVRLRGLQVAEDPAFGSAPFMTVAEGRMRIRLRSLFQGRVDLANLRLDEPRIHVVEDAAGRLNISTLGGSGGPSPASPPRVGKGRPAAPPATAVPLTRIRIVNGAIDYDKPGGRFTVERINATLTQSGGALRAAGDAQGPGGLKLTIADAVVTLSPGRPVGDAQMKATIDVESRDVSAAAAALGARTGVSGPLKGRLELAGTMNRITASGTLGFDRLTLSRRDPRCRDTQPRTLALSDVRMPLLYASPQLESQPVQAKVAKGTATFRLTVALGPPRVATLRDITVKGMQLEPVLVDYLCQRNAVTGALDLTGESSLHLPGILPTVAGSGRLSVGPGRVVGPDLPTALSQALALTDLAPRTLDPKKGRPGPGSPLSFDSITASYTITDGVVRTDDLVYVARDIRVTGAGTYALADERTAMDVTVTQGSNRVKARLTGAAGSLTIVPTDVRVKEPKDLRKALDRLLR